MNRQSLARRLTLALSIVVLALLSMAALRWHSSAMQQKAVSENPGLKCYYGEAIPGSGWLAGLLGVDYVQPIIAVLVLEPDDWGKTLKQLKTLDSLNEVAFWEPVPLRTVEVWKQELGVRIITLHADNFGQ